jgi:hypothetical protein
MPRLAGSGSHYNFRVLSIRGEDAEVAIVDSSGKLTDYKFAVPLDVIGWPEPGHEFGLPSVTSILDAVIAKPRLMHWYYTKGIEGVADLLKKYGPAMPREAASIKALLKAHKLSPYAYRDAQGVKGNKGHSDLEALVAGKRPALSAENEGLLEWWDNRGLHPSDVVASEVPLASFAHGFAGTVDLIYKDPETGRIVLCDLKTGKYISWTNQLQGVAYKIAYEEQGGVVDMVSILHVRPQGDSLGKKTWVEKTDPSITEQTFLSALNIYQALPVNWKPEDVE